MADFFDSFHADPHIHTSTLFVKACHQTICHSMACQLSYLAYHLCKLQVISVMLDFTSAYITICTHCCGDAIFCLVIVMIHNRNSVKTVFSQPLYFLHGDGVNWIGTPVLLLSSRTWQIRCILSLRTCHKVYVAVAKASQCFALQWEIRKSTSMHLLAIQKNVPVIFSPLYMVLTSSFFGVRMEEAASITSQMFGRESLPSLLSTKQLK